MLAFSAANTEGYILCFTEDQVPAAAEDDAPSEMMTSSDYSVSHRGTYLPIKYFCIRNLQSALFAIDSNYGAIFYNNQHSLTY